MTNSSGKVTVTGGEDSSLEVGNALLGQSSILYGKFTSRSSTFFLVYMCRPSGSGTATSTLVYPSATIAAWESFFASIQSATPTISPTDKKSNAVSLQLGKKTLSGLPVVVASALLIGFFSVL